MTDEQLLAKMLDTVILTAFLFLLLGIAGGVTSILMGAQMDAYETGLFVYSLCRDAAETLISVSRASVFIMTHTGGCFLSVCLNYCSNKAVPDDTFILHINDTISI